MIRSYDRGGIVESLLNSLEVERHVRGALLMSVVDELAGSRELAPATEAARALLVSVEEGACESDFALRLADLRALVRALAVPVSAASAVARAAGTADAA